MAEGLPALAAAVAIAGGHHEIMVVDNASTDGSVEFVRDNFPSVRVLALDRNYRFVGGNNRGIIAARHDIVVLLNNDMVVDRNFLNPLLDGFKDDTVFAVTSQIYFQEKGRRREETGKTAFFWRRGMIYAYHEEVNSTDAQRKYVPIVWAGGGSAAYNKEKFIQLGLFDELYLPCYVDDLDISYMAWKRGWKSLFCAESIVHHRHRATHDKQYSRDQLDVFITRNQILFLWKNLSSFSYLTSHFFFLPLHILKQAVKEKRFLLLKASLSALTRIPNVFRSRFTPRVHTSISDKMIFRGQHIRKSFDVRDRRLNILFVSPCIPCLDVHATGTRMYHIAQELSKKHEVDILTFIDQPSEQEHVQELQKFCRAVQVIERHQSLNEPDHFHITPNTVVKEYCQTEMKEAVFRHALSGRYDIIQFEYLQMAHLGSVIRQVGIPMVWVDHEVQHAALWKNFQHKRWGTWEKIELFFRWMVMLSFELKLTKAFNRTIVVTTNDEKELKGYLPGLRSSVVPLGVDLEYFSPESVDVQLSNEHILIFTGYFLHSPNVDAVLYFIDDVLPLIRKEIRDVQFWIVGSSPPARLTTLSGTDGITVTGPVPDLRPYLKKASVYVAPIRLGAGMRGKILEALGMKKAIVATPLAIQGIQVAPGEELLVADTALEFAREVIFLLKNKKERERLGERGRRAIESNFSWQSIAALNERALYSAIDQRESQTTSDAL